MLEQDREVKKIISNFPTQFSLLNSITLKILSGERVSTSARNFSFYWPIHHKKIQYGARLAHIRKVLSEKVMLRVVLLHKTALYFFDEFRTPNTLPPLFSCSVIYLSLFWEMPLQSPCGTLIKFKFFICTSLSY